MCAFKGAGDRAPFAVAKRYGTAPTCGARSPASQLSRSLPKSASIPPSFIVKTRCFEIEIEGHHAPSSREEARCVRQQQRPAYAALVGIERDRLHAVYAAKPKAPRARSRRDISRASRGVWCLAA
jgi:hypothetical protein